MAPTSARHPSIIIATVAGVTPEALEQLARSVATSPSLTDADRQAVVVALRMLADAERARRRHRRSAGESCVQSQRMTLRTVLGGDQG